MNWEAMLVCGAKRATGNNTANQPINPHKPGANAWLDGWADVLDVINSHSQVTWHVVPTNVLSWQGSVSAHPQVVFHLLLW